MRQRIKSIDGWRAVAALGVLYTHSWATMKFPTLKIAGIDIMRVLNLWGNGVQLFFVLSGFCFYLVLADDEKFTINRIFSFWGKRWLRIAPAFYFVCFILAFLKYESLQELFYKLLINFCFLQNTFPFSEVDAIFWSLAVEWHFYLLLPIILHSITRLGILKVTIGLVLICFALNLLHYSGYLLSNDQWWYSIFNNIGHFSWGILAAYLYKHGISIRFFVNNYSLLLGLIISYLGKLSFYSGVTEAFPQFSLILESGGPMLMSFGFAAIIYTTLFNRFSFQLIGNRIFSSIGMISYSFYLWHSFILSIVFKFFSPWIPETAGGVFILMALTLIILLPISYVSFNLLESFYFKRRTISS